MIDTEAYKKKKIRNYLKSEEITPFVPQMIEALKMKLEYNKIERHEELCRGQDFLFDCLSQKSYEWYRSQLSLYNQMDKAELEEHLHMVLQQTAELQYMLSFGNECYQPNPEERYLLGELSEYQHSLNNPTQEQQKDLSITSLTLERQLSTGSEKNTASIPFTYNTNPFYRNVAQSGQFASSSYNVTTPQASSSPFNIPTQLRPTKAFTAEEVNAEDGEYEEEEDL